LSGVFKYAKRHGILDGVNPMQDVSIPRGVEPRDTYAYSLEEIEQMLRELPEPAKTVVATAAFTGLRKGEIRGLTWGDYSGTELRVSRSVWGRHITKPKTARSTAPVPVIPLLTQMLDAQRGDLRTGPVFRARNGQPLNLDNLARRSIAPILAVNGLRWQGWHAFRRGLATNLHRLGVPDKTIQAILRHANISTTQNIYIKTITADTTEAMNRLESALCTQNRLQRPN
jgi:integrase